MDGSDGLAEVLAGKVPLNHALHEVSLATSPWGQLVSVRLRVLPSGHVPEDPAELLSSKGTERLLGDLTGTSDVVLVDAPPVLAVGDALVLAGVADGVLFVIGPQSASRSVLASARQQLDNVGANVVGAVLSEPDPSMTTSRFAY
jgi:Mrp family chromosome partitioning ATPase